MDTTPSSSTSQAALLNQMEAMGVKSTTPIYTLNRDTPVPRENISNETLQLLEEASSKINPTKKGIKRLREESPANDNRNQYPNESKPIYNMIYNIIYLIECTKCNKQYVGETSRQFRKRIYEHIASANNSNKIITSVSKHFSAKNHSYKNMKFSVIQWLGNENNPNMTIKRITVENSFIWNIPTVAPIGINQFI